MVPPVGVPIRVPGVSARHAWLYAFLPRPLQAPLKIPCRSPVCAPAAAFRRRPGRTMGLPRPARFVAPATAIQGRRTLDILVDAQDPRRFLVSIPSILVVLVGSQHPQSTASQRSFSEVGAAGEPGVPIAAVGGASRRSP